MKTLVELFILSLVTLGMSVTAQLGVETLRHPLHLTVEVLWIRTGLTPIPRVLTGGLTVVRVQQIHHIHHIHLL